MKPEYDNYVITLVARHNELDDSIADHICEIATNDISLQATPRILWLSIGTACDISLQLTGKNIQRNIYNNILTTIAEKYEIDFAVQPSTGRKKKLLISDMDSTMIQQECIDMLAEHIGIGDKVSQITEKAMRGELDFVAALEERVALLKGLEERHLEEVYRNKITTSKGAKTLIKTMKANGAYTLLVSGGFTYFTEKIQKKLGFDAQEANRLDFDKNGQLTGKVIHPVLDKHAKLDSLKHHCNRLGMSEKDALAVGDGANDLPMLKAAGLGVSYYGKNIVRENSDAIVSYTDLSSLLYFQGYKKEEFVND